MADIIIKNVNVTNLYNELITQRKTIREGASKIIADNIDLAKSLTRTLLESKDVEEIKKLATEAHQALETVSLVSYVSGVQYYLPYSSNYDDSSDIMSQALDGDYYDYDEDSTKFNGLLNEVPEVDALTSLFRDLEYQSGKWNTSFC